MFATIPLVDPDYVKFGRQRYLNWLERHFAYLLESEFAGLSELQAELVEEILEDSGPRLTHKEFFTCYEMALEACYQRGVQRPDPFTCADFGPRCRMAIIEA